MTNFQLGLVVIALAALTAIITWKAIVAPLGRAIAHGWFEPAIRARYQRKLMQARADAKAREQRVKAALEANKMAAVEKAKAVEARRLLRLKRQALRRRRFRKALKLMWTLPMTGLNGLASAAAHVASRVKAWREAQPQRKLSRKWQKLSDFRVGRPDRKARYQRALGKLPMAEFQDRQLFVGDKIRVATTYRIFADGEWQSVTWVAEPASNKTYWLAGDPKEDSQIEGFLMDRKALPLQSQAVH